MEDLSLKSCVMQISVKFSYFIRKFYNRDRKLKNIPNIIGKHGGVDKIQQKESSSGLKTVQVISLNLTLRMPLWSGVSHKLWFCHSQVITSLRLCFVASHWKTLYKLDGTYYRDISLKKATNQEIRKIPFWLATTICISWEWREIQLENTWLNLLSSKPPKTKKSEP